MHFTLTQRKTVFKYQYFVIYGANVSPAMFLRSFSNFNDSETVSYEHVTYKKTFKIAIINDLISEKLDQSKYLQKLMSWNSKVEIFESQ